MLSALEARWVRIVLASFAAEQTAGSGPTPSPGLSARAGEVDYLGTFTGMRASAGPMACLGMRLALWLVVLAPCWHAHRRTTLVQLPLDERQALLGALLEHRLFAVREATLLLKLGASLALFASDAVRARSGYDGTRAPVVPVARLRKSAS